MSHDMKLHILSLTYIHTVCIYVTFSGHGAFQIFRTSAVATEQLSCLHELLKVVLFYFALTEQKPILTQH